MAQKMTLDFSQVKDGGSFSPKHKEEGEYLATVTSFEDTKSKSGNAMWVFGLTLKSDRRATYPVYCVLNADSLWKLRQVLMAAGIRVPKKRLTVDGNRLVGKDIGVFLEDDEYEGKKKSVITSFFPAEEYSGEDSGDDLPDEDAEEELEDEENENSSDYGDEDQPEFSDDEDDSDDEEDEEEELAPKKVAKKAPARAAVKKKAPEPADDEDEEEDDE